MNSERKTSKKLSVMLVPVLLALGLLAPAVGLADTCEIPLFVKQGLDGANVMLLADISGSMNEVVWATGYDHNTAYSGNFNRDSTYFISTDGSYDPKDFRWDWPSSPQAYLVNSDNGEQGRYSGNYLNWLYFHASDTERATIPNITRIQMLKAILIHVLSRSQRLDFGLTVFRTEDGGRVLGECGADIPTLQTTISGLTANTWTPLGESMETVLDYFKRDDAGAPIQVECQYNFVVVVTDGEPTMDRDVSGYLWDADHDSHDPGSCTSIGAGLEDFYDCSDHFDDVAYYMNHTDLRPDMEGDQNVITYVVGYHEDNSLLAEAAQNGGGLFFQANSALELYLSIEYALQDILRRISAGSAVAVVSTEQGYDNRLYRGKFMPVDWTGFMECYQLPYSQGDVPLWEAGELLRVRSTASRRIFTSVDGVVYDFVTGNAPYLREKMMVATDEETEKLINWGRGNYVPGFRYRQGWRLGTIVHSTPVVVGAPATYEVSESYQTFFQSHEHRQKMVYVGANDGMLHGFDANSGAEEWAYVPQFALPVFEVMADSSYCHKYSVDQTVTVKDVRIDGTWHTVLVSGGRQGGHSVFALDVTYPDSPQLMWESSMPNGVDFSSDVVIATIDGEPVALVGSGLDYTDQDAYIYTFSMRDGTVLGEELLGTAAGGLRNKATCPAVVDLDFDGEDDVVYIGDLQGDMLRFSINGKSNPSKWARSTIYEGGQQITANPVVAFDKNGQVNVYFGTGAYLDDDDMTTSDLQSFLCIFDDHSGDTRTKSDLADQTSSINDVTGQGGWYLDLVQKLGERVTQPAAVVAETVIFTTFAPDLDACVAGGTSYLYQMRFDTGGQSEGQDGPGDRVEDLGNGIASYPVVDLAAGTVVVQKSDASISVSPIAATIQRMRVRSWQENFDHVQGAPQVQ